MRIEVKPLLGRVEDPHGNLAAPDDTTATAAEQWSLHQTPAPLPAGRESCCSCALAACARYDVAEHLRTPEEMAAYLEASLEEAQGDAAFIAKALGDIARARGMSQVARDAGLSRESLYKALSGERNPDFKTILKVITALGLRLHAEAAHA